MRYLNINGCDFEITDMKAKKLLASGAVYQCGENHDLHLTPDHPFSFDEVEILLTGNEE